MKKITLLVSALMLTVATTFAQHIVSDSNQTANKQPQSSSVLTNERTAGDYLIRAANQKMVSYACVGLSATIMIASAANGNEDAIKNGLVVGGLFGIAALIFDIASITNVRKAGIKLNQTMTLKPASEGLGGQIVF